MMDNKDRKLRAADKPMRMPVMYYFTGGNAWNRKQKHREGREYLNDDKRWQ